MPGPWRVIGARRDHDQICLVVEDTNGKEYALADDELRWRWRVVMTSETVANERTGVPISLVIAQKADKAQVECRHCHRAESARLFKTSQRQERVVYFTRCHKCWRSFHVQSVPY